MLSLFYIFASNYKSDKLNSTYICAMVTKNKLSVLSWNPAVNRYKRWETSRIWETGQFLTISEPATLSDLLVLVYRGCCGVGLGGCRGGGKQGASWLYHCHSLLYFTYRRWLTLPLHNSDMENSPFVLVLLRTTNAPSYKAQQMITTMSFECLRSTWNLGSCYSSFNVGALSFHWKLLSLE